MLTRNNPRQFGLRRYRSRLRTFSGLPDLTALIDVLFLALIFFMLSSSFVQLSGIRVELPEVENPSSADIEKFVLSITVDPQKNCRMYFNDQPVNWEELKEKLAEVSQFSRTATIVLRASRDTPHEVTTRVWALAEKARLSVFVVVAPARSKPETSFGS